MSLNRWNTACAAETTVVLQAWVALQAAVVQVVVTLRHSGAADPDSMQATVVRPAVAALQAAVVLRCGGVPHGSAFLSLPMRKEIVQELQRVCATSSPWVVIKGTGTANY